MQRFFFFYIYVLKMVVPFYFEFQPLILFFYVNEKVRMVEELWVYGF